MSCASRVNATSSATARVATKAPRIIVSKQACREEVDMMTYCDPHGATGRGEGLTNSRTAPQHNAICIRES